MNSAAQQPVERTPGAAHRLFAARRFGPSPAFLVFVTCSVIAWARLTPTTRGTLWAEDGPLFVGDAVHRNQLTAIFRPYAGYLQFVPRLAADVVVDLVSVRHIAEAMTAAACLTAGVCAAVVYVCSAALTTSRPGRIGFAAITVAAPMLPIEVMGNVANVHSFFLWTAPWLMLYTPRSRRESVALAAFALVGALTEIQMLLALPLGLVDWRARLRWPVVGAILVGEAGQVVATTVSPRRTPGRATPTMAEQVRGYLANVVHGVWQAGAKVMHVAPAQARLLEVLTVVLVLAATVASCRKGTSRVRVAALAFPALSAVVWLLATTFNRADTFPIAAAHGATYHLLRYGVVPSMFLLASLVLGVVTAVDGASLLTLGAAALAVGLMAAAVLNFQPAGTARRTGPVFSRTISTLRPTCEGRPGNEERSISIAPKGWVMSLPCRALTSGHA